MVLTLSMWGNETTSEEYEHALIYDIILQDVNKKNRRNIRLWGARCNILFYN